jgi:hypothetical protein
MLGDPKKEGLSPKRQKEYDAEIIGFLPHMPTKYFTKTEELNGAISTIKTIRRVPIKVTS